MFDLLYFACINMTSDFDAGTYEDSFLPPTARDMAK
jgi:hypothetical protein